MPSIYNFFFETIKKNYLHGATWNTFVKKNFPCKYKKDFLQIHGPTWDNFIKNNYLLL